MFSFPRATAEDTLSAVSLGCGGSAMDFNLPEEILSVIPTDPYEQLDMARKITSMAIASRVSNMEAEMARMRDSLCQKDRTIYDLEEKLSRLQQANQEADSRSKLAFAENVKLSKERDSLAITARKLSRDLAKLETFKRQLMQSLSDDNASQDETVDIGTCDQPVPKAYPYKDDISDCTSNHSFNGLTGMGNTFDEATRHAGQRFSITPYIMPRLSPTGTPKIISTSISPKDHSAALSPQRSSATTSPTKTSYDGRTSLSSWYSSSQQSSRANSPPRGHSLPVRTRIDGKQFFRQARSRLSYEQFSAFLTNIKELNAQKQTREDALRKAEEIFGTDNQDLFLSFQGLLNRNVR